MNGVDARRKNVVGVAVLVAVILSTTVLLAVGEAKQIYWKKAISPQATPEAQSWSVSTTSPTWT